MTNTQTPPRQKVSIIWQVIGSWIPIASIFIYLRIEKFWAGWGVNALSTFAGITIVVIFAQIIHSLFPENNSVNLMANAIIGFGIALAVFSYVGIHTFFIVKWSREWNQNADNETESESKNHIIYTPFLAIGIISIIAGIFIFPTESADVKYLYQIIGVIFWVVGSILIIKGVKIRRRYKEQNVKISLETKLNQVSESESGNDFPDVQSRQGQSSLASDFNEQSDIQKSKNDEKQF